MDQTANSRLGRGRLSLRVGGEDQPASFQGLLDEDQYSALTYFNADLFMIPDLIICSLYHME